MRKGIRQGNILLPFLFNIVVQGLVVHFGRAMEGVLYSS
jgi:hypothetical protein